MPRICGRRGRVSFEEPAQTKYVFSAVPCSSLRRKTQVAPAPKAVARWSCRTSWCCTVFLAGRYGQAVLLRLSDVNCSRQWASSRSLMLRQYSRTGRKRVTRGGRREKLIGTEDGPNTAPVALGKKADLHAAGRHKAALKTEQPAWSEWPLGRCGALSQIHHWPPRPMLCQAPLIGDIQPSQPVARYPNPPLGLVYPQNI